MQYINLNKIIELENKIQDLLLINIDDNLETIDDNEGVRISGKINIGGSVKTLEGDRNFYDSIDLDIFISYEEIEERNLLKINIQDFNYKVDDNKLNLDISISIEGLKEIIPSFPTQENNEIICEEEIEENKNIIHEEDDIELGMNGEVEEERNEYINIKYEEENLDDNEVQNYISKIDNGENYILEIEKKSLLKSVFSNKRIKEEVSWKLHCVNKEKTYEEIATKYGVDLAKLQSINKNEQLKEGMLIFIPLN